MGNIISWDIIKRFSGNDQDCFTYQDVVSKYPDTDKIYLSKVLSGLVGKGMLIKLNRNLYHIVPSSTDANTYIPEWHLVAKYLMKREVILYWLLFGNADPWTNNTARLERNCCNKPPGKTFLKKNSGD